LDRFQTCFLSCDDQFGFKKGRGCRNAIDRARKIVNKIVKGGDMVNICAIDLRKASDKMNHKSLYIKLMPLVNTTLLKVLIISEILFTCISFQNTETAMNIKCS